MARPKLQKKSILVACPAGVKLDKALLKRAKDAAQAIVNESTGALALQAQLRKLGLVLSLADVAKLQASKVTAPKAAAAAPTAKAPKAPKSPKAPKARKARKGRKGRRTRVVLTAEQRAKALEKLKAGDTAGSVAKEFGVSMATVNIMKRAAGLTKPRAKKVKKS